MKAAPQRQDITFLALAVAVLTIAIALFIIVRLLPDRAEPPAPPEPVAEAVPEAPELPPGDDADRDPFQSEVGQTAAADGGGELRLVGLMPGPPPLVVIRRGDHHSYVRIGESVGGYTVVSIGPDRAVLARDDDRVTLLLHP
jgi:hypothetical protein